jgi:uncharacterized LabA/DUF88 family protein
MKTIVYIDGYNWYHAVFKHRPDWKWLNAQTFFEKLLHRDDLLSVKMFSAMIDPGKSVSDARDRQEKYFSALKTLPKIKIILGAFQPREVTCKATCGAKYQIQDEKKTDVNIALEMISDSLAGVCEKMCVVTGDSDIQPVVEWVCRNNPKIKIYVYIPALPNLQRDRRIDYYLTQKLPVECKFLPLETIKDHQFKDLVKVTEPEVKLFCRPHLWK